MNLPLSTLVFSLGSNTIDSKGVVGRGMGCPGCDVPFSESSSEEGATFNETAATSCHVVDSDTTLKVMRLLTATSIVFDVLLHPSAFLRNALVWAAGTLMGDELFAGAARASRKKTVTEYYKLMQEKLEYSIKFQKEVWDKYRLDGIIAPVQAVPQLPHGGCDKFSAMGEATSIYNVLDLPTGCLPVTRVDPARDQVTDEWLDGPGRGSHMLETGIYRDKPPLYDSQLAAGMPIGIQVVGQKWEDEKVLEMMKVVDEALGKERGFGPGAWTARV